MSDEQQPRTDEELRQEDELVEATDSEVVRLWRVWRTAHEMCSDRGYEFAEEEIHIPLAEFKQRFTDQQGRPNRIQMSFSARPSTAMMAKYTDPPTPKNPNPEPKIGTVWVEFSGHEKFGIQQMRQFCHHVAENNYHTGISISKVSAGPTAVKIIPTVKPHEIELFQEDDLLVNITKHELVPKHVLLSGEEKKALLERYRVKESQLPRIQHADPVARYMGLRRGQVVKIIRRSETAGRYASYRWCI